MPRQLAMISSRHKRTVRISLRAKASGQDIAMAATEALGAVRISLWRQLECWEWSEYRYGGAYRWSGFRHACGRRSEYRYAQKRAVRISLNPKARGQNIAMRQNSAKFFQLLLAMQQPAWFRPLSERRCSAHAPSNLPYPSQSSHAPTRSKAPLSA